MKEPRKAIKINRVRKWHHQWRWRRKWTPPSVGRMLPNLVTLAALCMGLSAIRFAFLSEWRQATVSVLIAGLLDGLDGQLARLLKTSSEFGAELDSLADFINFGVAPTLIVYCFSLQTMGSRGWALCLFFSACMALRLARFNIQRHHKPSLRFSTGVPAPAGALLVLFPLITGFVFELTLSPWYFAFMMLFTSIMLVSHYPTFVFKKIVIPPAYLGPFLVCALALVAGLVSIPWETLFIFTLFYIGTLPLSGYLSYKKGLL